MKSNVNIASHPVHPYLVLLPVGAWVAALLFDILYLVYRSPFWYSIAYYNILFGVVTALLAATVGMTDLFTLRMWDRAKTVGYIHMALNLAILLLFVISLVIRTRADGALVGRAMTGVFVLDAVAVGMLLISGWLGQELVYRWGVAVPEETIRRIPSVTWPTSVVAAPRMAGARGGEREEEEGEQR